MERAHYHGQIHIFSMCCAFVSEEWPRDMTPALCADLQVQTAILLFYWAGFFKSKHSATLGLVLCMFPSFFFLFFLWCCHFCSIFQTPVNLPQADLTDNAKLKTETSRLKSWPQLFFEAILQIFLSSIRLKGGFCNLDKTTCVETGVYKLEKSKSLFDSLFCWFWKLKGLPFLPFLKDWSSRPLLLHYIPDLPSGFCRSMSLSLPSEAITVQRILHDNLARDTK